MAHVINVNQVRDLLIGLNGLVNVDCDYTFYYDETNNIRRLHVSPAGLNVRAPTCFVLGGIAHPGPQRGLDVVGLGSALRVQATVKELKLSHLGKGDLLELLKSSKVEAFLDWLMAEGLLIHYSAIDPLYWSTVDIVDSIICHEPMRGMLPFQRELKANLYSLLSADVDDVGHLFDRFGYPNVGRAQRIAFLKELLVRLDARADLLGAFNAQMLKGVLQAGTRSESLVFLENVPPKTQHQAGLLRLPLSLSQPRRALL